jgi:hypothetical protein
MLPPHAPLWEGALYHNINYLTINFGAQGGKRNKDGIPLPKLVKLKIVGKTGLKEVRAWIKRWLKK